MYYINQIKELNELLNSSYRGEEIGYGEKAVSFENSECDSLEEFEENGAFGTYFEQEGIFYCKVRSYLYDDEEAVIVFENENDEIEIF